MARRKVLHAPEIAAAWRISRPGLAAVVIFSVFVNALKFAMPLYLVQVLDRVPASRSIETLVMLTVIAVSAIATGLALDVIRRRLMLQWGAWIERRFGPILLERQFNESTLDRSVEVGGGLEILSRIRNFLSSSAVFWLDLLWAPVFVLGVYIIHPLLGTVAVISLMLLIVLGVMMDYFTRQPRKASFQAGRTANDLLSAAERNRESVGALTMGKSLAERWREAFSDRLDERERIDGRSQAFRVTMQGLGQFLRIAMLGIGVWLLLEDALTIGAIFAARIMAGFAFNLVERAARNWRGMREAIASYRSLQSRLAQDPTAAPSVPESAMRGNLEIDLVTHKYPGQRDDVIRRLSLTLQPGELLAINGPAASGKTTLSHLLVGLLEPRHGHIRLGDIDIQRLPPEKRARLIGYLAPQTELFDGTIRENIARMGDGSFDAVVEAAKRVGIHELIVRLPLGYDTPIDSDTFGPLSSSQRKRIAMARAIYEAPQLVVFDEPSANLDRPSRRLMEAALAELKEAGSIIVVTQAIESPQINRMADMVLTLGGRAPEITDARDSDDASPTDGKTKLRRVK